MEASADLIALILGSIVNLIVSLGLTILQIVAWWKVFQKAGRPGWAILIPFYNAYVMFRIVQLPFILFFLPVILAFLATINPASAYIMAWLIIISTFAVYWTLLYRYARAFGYGIGFTLGLFFLHPIFISILGFGSAQPGGVSSSPAPVAPEDHSKGESLYRKGDYSAALDWFARAVEANPHDWEAQARVVDILAGHMDERMRLAEERTHLLKVEGVPQELWVSTALALGKDWEELGHPDWAINVYKGLLWKYHEGYDEQEIHHKIEQLGA
jgi:tetratricopeptide (TPR) repeat protein